MSMPAKTKEPAGADHYSKISIKIILYDQEDPPDYDTCAADHSVRCYRPNATQKVFLTPAERHSKIK